MGLLSVFKKDKQRGVATEAVEFTAKRIESSNVPNDLAQLAKTHNMSVKELDFQVLSYKTYYKKVDKPRFRELQEIDREKFFAKENILNPDLEIMQKIKLEVFKKSNSKFPIKIIIGANRELTKVMATIKQQKKVQYIEGLVEEIMANIDQKKVKLGILLGCFDSEIRQEVKKVVSTIRVNKSIGEDVRFPICQAYEAQQQIIGEIKYKYKEQEDVSNEQIDHSKKGYMHTIAEGDVMIELIHSQDGIAGRDCKGAILIPRKIELTGELPDITVTDDIEIVEQEKMTQYIAKIQGFINEISDNNFEIRDELVVDEVSFRTTGSINAGDDKNIKINVASSDSMSDAIGSGMNIETTEIKVGGNVGSGAVVRAKQIEIGGQTHQSSKLLGGDINIHLHKGFADGENIVVEILEAGKVVGDIVRVKKAMGGTIEAKEVYIESVLSNVHVSASHYIEIDKIEGSANKFIIDAVSQRGFKDKKENIENILDKSDVTIRSLTKKLKQIKVKLKRDEDSITEVRAHIKSLMNAKTKPPSALLKKLQENQNIIKEHNLVLKELKDAKISKETLIEDLKDLQSSVFDAKVVSNSIWRDYNEVSFNIIDPAVKVSHLFQDGESASEITLKSMEEGKYVLEKKG